MAGLSSENCWAYNACSTPSRAILRGCIFEFIINLIILQAEPNRMDLQFLHAEFPQAFP